MLTNCIENLLCGVIPEEPFVLQLVDYWRVMNPTNGIFAPDGRFRMVLSDGNHCGSTFIYVPERNDFQPLPTKNSIIEIYSARSWRPQNSFIIIIDNFEVIAESNGRIRKIGNPFFPMTDPRGHPLVD